MKRIFLLSILCLMTFTGSAQSALTLRNLNMSMGLSDNFVRSIVCDHDGMIWLLTMNSINRYDGYRVWEYAVQGSIFIGDNLHDIRESADSVLWVTGDLHLYYYNSQSDRMEICTTKSLARYGIRDSVNRLFVDEERNLWFITADGRKCHHYDIRQRKLSTLSQPKGTHVISLCGRGEETFAPVTSNAVSICATRPILEPFPGKCP